MDLLQTLEQYKQEVAVDTSLDESNLREKQMTLAAIRHKWSARVIRTKHDLSVLYRQRKSTLANLVAKAGQEVVGLSDRAIATKASNTAVIAKIDQMIEDTNTLIEYLERVDKIISAMGFDIKNIIEIIKLETT